MARRRSLPIVLAGLALLLTGGAALAATGGAGAGPSDPDNPCLGPEAGRLLCPDLTVGPAEDLYVTHGAGGYYGQPGRVLLHAGNDIRSRGRGPMELRGRRYKPGWMRANQAIYRVGGGVRILRTEAELHYVHVGYRYGGAYWKVHNPLSMEIWSLSEDGGPDRLLRKGPKVFYCFRDLERTRPMPRSPSSRVYPACNQDPNRRRTRLGTSVGWSDIYPATYDRQWVNVTGLARGCYVFVMDVDPLDLLSEENEDNNRSTRRFRLPYRPGPQRC